MSRTALAFALAFAFAFAAPAQADTYTLSIGGGAIGTLAYAPGSLESNVTSSPLGVGNGSFSATSQPVRLPDGRAATQYLSHSTGKGRTISVLHDGGQVIETTVSPAGDATDLSTADAVPAGIVDPVAALGALLEDRATCPAALRFYDGRRVIAITPTGSGGDGAALTCAMDYRVIAGPGHFSPLYIKSADMTLSYDAGRLRDLSISAGLFTLHVTP